MTDRTGSGACFFPMLPELPRCLLLCFACACTPEVQAHQMPKCYPRYRRLAPGTAEEHSCRLRLYIVGLLPQGSTSVPLMEDSGGQSAGELLPAAPVARNPPAAHHVTLSKLQSITKRRHLAFFVCLRRA